MKSRRFPVTRTQPTGSGAPPLTTSRTLYTTTDRKGPIRQWSIKAATHGCVICESRLESVMVCAADLDSRVIRIRTQATVMDLTSGLTAPNALELKAIVREKKHSVEDIELWFIDLEIQIVDGRTIFVEVKPQNRAMTPKTAKKLTKQKQACEKRGKPYLLLTDGDISLDQQKNILLLHQYLSQPIPGDVQETIIQWRAKERAISGTPSELGRRLNCGLGVIYGLAAKGYLDFEWKAGRLCVNTQLNLGRGTREILPIGKIK